MTTGDVLTGNDATIADSLPATRVRAKARRWRGIPSAGGVYLLGSLILWSKIWTGHPTTTTNITTNDTSAFIWFLGWPAYALTHGQSLFYTTALFHPTGFNLLANTGVLAIGLPLMPVTWLFGPVASLNVALTLAPVVSALGMFVLLRRWVTWLPAAFVGGALYGFCPFILQSLTEGQLHQGFLMFPPLIVLCFDELIFRQRARASVTGLVLGLLATAQFFVGTEILVMLAFVVACCFVIIAAFWARQSDRSMHRIRYAARGLLVGCGVSVLLLAYPVWFALAGPAHLSGRVWPFPLPYFGNSLADFIKPVRSATTAFFGAGFSRQYLGLGLVVVCIAGLCIWCKDKKLQVAAAAAGISLLLSLGASHQLPLPWSIFGNLPLLENIFPDRFVIIAYLALAVMLGLIVDHVYVAVAARSGNSPSGAQPAQIDFTGVASSPGMASVAAFAVAALALVPLAAYVAPYVPATVRPVVFPSWFRHIGPTLSGHQVLLVLPMPFILENSLTWQALDHFRYDLASGVGPEGHPSRAGRDAPAEEFLLSLSRPTSPTVTPEAITMVRQAIDRWGVTTIVIPTDGTAPPADWRVNSVPISAAFMTLVTGTRPVLQDDAWVWYGVESNGPPVTRSNSKFYFCAATATASADMSPSGTVDRLIDCLLAPVP